MSLISGDIGKLCLKLVKKDAKTGIFSETYSPSFSPVLEKPNRYQTRIEFLIQWVISLLAWGNTYIYKERDGRNVVTAMYVLNPRLVQPLVSPDGSIFYALSTDNLSGIEESITVPASEIIHDRINPLFHPLVGIPPIYACGLAAEQGLQIQKNSEKFFRGGANPSGIVTVPGRIDQTTADQMKKDWGDKFSGDNAGTVAILPDGLKFAPLTMTSVDAQLIDQLKITAEQVCTTFHVPPYMVGVTPPPPYNNIESLNQQYYSQCLQILIEKIEVLLKEGLVLPDPMYVQLDIKQLLRMDSATRIETNAKAVKGGIMTPNEARAEENLPPVAGGDTPYLQQQEFSLAALAKRDALPNPFVIDRPTQNPTPDSNGTTIGPADKIDPAAKAITLEILDCEFSLVTSQCAPLLLAAPAHTSKAA